MELRFEWRKFPAKLNFRQRRTILQIFAQNNSIVESNCVPERCLRRSKHRKEGAKQLQAKDVEDLNEALRKSCCNLWKFHFILKKDTFLGKSN